MLLYLDSLKLGANEPNSDDSFPGIQLILGGYSYGSLIASHLPGVEAVVGLFRHAASGSAPYEIATLAEEVSRSSEERLHLRAEPPTASRTPRVDTDGFDRISGSTISYLLMSPLLPPLSNLLTIFSELSLDVEAETPAQGKQIPCPKPDTQLCRHRTLAIYGNQDGFTSAKKLRKWSDELSRMPQSQYQHREIDRAGHFWREDGVEKQARMELQDWLKGLDL